MLSRSRTGSVSWFTVSRRFSTNHKQSKQLFARLRWFGIPMTLGVSCIGLLHLRRVLWKERDNPASPHPMTWQVGHVFNK